MFDNIIELNDMLNKKVNLELEERMDDLAFDYVSLFVDMVNHKYPDGATDVQMALAMNDFAHEFGLRLTAAMARLGQ